jgi:hypothetical protein
MSEIHSEIVKGVKVGFAISGLALTASGPYCPPQAWLRFCSRASGDAVSSPPISQQSPNPLLEIGCGLGE